MIDTLRDTLTVVIFICSLLAVLLAVASVIVVTLFAVSRNAPEHPQERKRKRETRESRKRQNRGTRKRKSHGTRNRKRRKRK